ncbi:hypothetical protein R0K18_28660, partial [Pantoea sp. SIMBA_133]
GKQALQQMTDTGIRLSMGQAKTGPRDILQLCQFVGIARRQEQALLSLGPTNQHQVSHPGQTQGCRIVITLDLGVPDMHTREHGPTIDQPL